MLSSLSTNIKNERLSRNWTTRQLAEKAGISHGMISDYENGMSKPRPNVLKKIADAFELAVPDLLYESRYTQARTSPDFNNEIFKIKLSAAETLDVGSKAAIMAVIDQCLEKKRILDQLKQIASPD